MPLALPSDQKALQALVDRRHPRYAERAGDWRFCRATHDGGRAWFEENLHRYLKEGSQEFKDRKARAYRFNHTREVVRLVTKYIFKGEAIRNREEAPEALRRFWRSATLKGAGIDALMRRACDLSAIYGRAWLLVDSRAAKPVLTRAEEKAGAARVYAYTVTPEDMLDYAWDDDGELLWAMWRYPHREAADPTRPAETLTRYSLWTRDAFAVLEERHRRAGGAGGRPKREVTVVQAGDNPVGRVPAVAVDEQESDDPYDAPALVGDIAYLDRAVANYLSNLDAIIQDQTFSQLAMPAQGLMPGEEGYDKVREMGTKRVFLYDGEGGSKPFYLSPDASQAQVILATVNKIIGEIYHSIGMAGERTRQDNAVGIDNSSGVAKAYDFERVNSLLAAKADVLERAEDALAALVCDFAGEALPADPSGDGPKDLVKYPDSFDVRGLYDEFEIAENLSLLEAPDEVRREQMRALVAKLFPRHPAGKLSAIEAELKSWPPKLEAVEAGLMSSQRSKGAVGSLRRSEPRQGQVTDKTP